ncbi:hypothetical protein K402DRAFT_389658 [Aulographum hederae CBS 113979]|uniref:Uncharacterized protein n=1 Tax=Aulographum hederae CBS 113979 TaxID=1176131 RepID=A0A6G1HCJ3_9PEZI|nr:hypothetical protein K402DRAFT_389658 [Aulographum hederae CBS 113979]
MSLDAKFIITSLVLFALAAISIRIILREQEFSSTNTTFNPLPALLGVALIGMGAYSAYKRIQTGDGEVEEVAEEKKEQ